MKKFLIAVLLVVSFAIAGCDDGDDGERGIDGIIGPSGTEDAGIPDGYVGVYSDGVIHYCPAEFSASYSADTKGIYACRDGDEWTADGYDKNGLDKNSLLRNGCWATEEPEAGEERCVH